MLGTEHGGQPSKALRGTQYAPLLSTFEKTIHSFCYRCVRFASGEVDRSIRGSARDQSTPFAYS
jgi:hypothetical protein